MERKQKNNESNVLIADDENGLLNHQESSNGIELPQNETETEELFEAGNVGEEFEILDSELEKVVEDNLLKNTSEELNEEFSVSSETSLSEITNAENGSPILDAYFGSFDASEENFNAVENASNTTSESIIGRDDRIKINNTTAYPWRAIASLLIESKTGKFFVGTGWFVSARTLITAGHCLYLHNEGGWAKSIRVMAGRNGASMPFGSVKATRYRSVTGWTRSKKAIYDYGAIILPSKDRVGSRTGTFGYSSLKNNSLKNKNLNLSGYPGDKPSGEQWYHHKKVNRLSSRQIHYQIDTMGGQSGSPVWYIKNGKRYAVGIHAYGKGAGNTNAATRIVKPVFDNIKAWKALGA